jgi:hypothetical protein
MRIAGWAALMAIGCGSAGASPQSLIGNWMSRSSDGTTDVAATFTGDGAYALSLLQPTSATTAIAQVEKGAYAATDDQFTATPQEYSCPGPDPATTVTYTLNGATLQVDGASGIVDFASSGAPVEEKYTLTYGCFQPNGSFVTSPLTPVND